MIRGKHSSSAGKSTVRLSNAVTRHGKSDAAHPVWINQIIGITSQYPTVEAVRISGKYRSTLSVCSGDDNNPLTTKLLLIYLC